MCGLTVNSTGLHAPDLDTDSRRIRLSLSPPLLLCAGVRGQARTVKYTERSGRFVASTYADALSSDNQALFLLSLTITLSSIQKIVLDGIGVIICLLLHMWHVIYEIINFPRSSHYPLRELIRANFH